MFGSSSLFLCSGGTRFIGVYLARQLVEAGHEVTLLTRGKKPVTSQIPDDTDQGFEQYKSAIKHIAADRTDADALKQQLSGAGFQGNFESHYWCNSMQDVVHSANSHHFHGQHDV